MNDIAIHIEAVTKSYLTGDRRPLPVLKGVDLDVPRGTVVAILGPSGAGKSTLLHIAGALDEPTSGTVLLAGNNVFAMGDAALSSFRNRHVGFVFQFHHLLPEFTALENVCMPALIAGTAMAQARERAIALLTQVGVEHRMQAKPAQLSGGEQQRVAVARALMNRPTVLLADEPSGNLDRENATLLHDLLLTLAHDEGHAIVLVTHDEELSRRADLVCRLQDGHLTILHDTP